MSKLSIKIRRKNSKIEKEKKERSKNVIFYQSTYKSVRLSFHQINKEENIGKLEFNS